MSNNNKKLTTKNNNGVFKVSRQKSQEEIIEDLTSDLSKAISNIQSLQNENAQIMLALAKLHIGGNTK